MQRDRDGKYAGFDAAMKRQRVHVLKGAVRSPNCRAFVERFIGTIRRECLNYFLFFGSTHLDSVVKIWLGFYHRLRPHQGLENEMLMRKKKRGRPKSTAEDEAISPTDIRCRRQLSGLLKSYSRIAA